MSSPPKVVLITGCSKGGIGFNLCEQFAERGCIVYASSRRTESMEGFKHARIRRLALDVTSEEDINSAVKNVLDAEGRIDIVVNNAGIVYMLPKTGPAIDISIEQVKTTFDTNVYAALRMARAVIPHMAARKQGLIINVGSIVGEIATPWNGLYCASKAALHCLTDVLKMECTPFNIKVMLLSPGAVKSNIAANHASIFNLPPTSLYKSFLDQIVSRMHASQAAGSMPTAEFAKIVVDNALRKNPPRYLTLGGNSTLLGIFKWLPKGFVLWMLWRRFSRK